MTGVDWNFLECLQIQINKKINIFYFLIPFLTPWIQDQGPKSVCVLLPKFPKLETLRHYCLVTSKIGLYDHTHPHLKGAVTRLEVDKDPTYPVLLRCRETSRGGTGTVRWVVQSQCKRVRGCEVEGHRHCRSNRRQEVSYDEILGFFVCPSKTCPPKY